MLMRHFLWPLVGLAVLAGSSVISFPRFSVEQSVPCGECHLNPNGGGMRNEFGNYAVALNELCLPGSKAASIKRYRKPRLSESLTFGFDSRYLLMDNGWVFNMQNDLFLAAEPLKDVYYHLRIGASGGVDDARVSESYALMFFSERKFYFKGGRFYPAYGLRQSDHKSFVRERTGHTSNTYLDGFSVGGNLAGFSGSLEFFQPGNRGVYVAHLSKVGFFDRFGYLGGLSLRLSEERGGSNGSFPAARSLFGGLSFDRYTLMGEVDLLGKASDTLVVYANFTTRLEYGLYLIGEYNFYDGDRDLATGADEFYRLSIELYPFSFVQLRPSYTYYSEGPRDGEDDYFLQLHIGY